MSIPLSQLKIACILDEFSYECFRHECQLIQISPSDWKEVIHRERPHFLFVESAWRGNDYQWRYKLGNYKNNMRNEIIELTSYCKKLGIPTVFWNKEDPVHFDFFFNTAALFDYVFTTDENCIKKYKQKLRHDRVFALPFAAQPKIHNPIKVPNYRSKNICFAGTYYGNHHRERTLDMNLLLKVASKYGLEIFDRNYELKTNYQYPYTFRRFIKGYLPYDKLVNVSKQYKIFLNVNSVKNSPTMCARRVFELLASGVTVLSNKSDAMDYLFGNTVLTFTDRLSIKQAIIQSLFNEEWRSKHELKGLRRVYQNHTYAHRLHFISVHCGLKVEAPAFPTIHVIGYANSINEVETIHQLFHDQTYSNKRLTIIIDKKNKSLKKKTIETTYNIPTLILDKQKPLPKNLFNNTDFLSLFSPSHYYGPYYLTDLALASLYTEAKIIGKGSYFSYNPNFMLNHASERYSYVDEILNDASIIHRSIIKQINPSLSTLLNNELKQIDPKTTFSIDPYNFFYNYFKSEKLVQNILNKVNG